MVPAGVFFIAIAIPFPSSAASMMTGAGPPPAPRAVRRKYGRFGVPVA
ncbi:hypothetical protein JOF35_000677 [Streptomyces demainii]|nr:hypothetical protein [Streptomyces demainii]